MSQPKLILINGPCGIGKSTIAQRYAQEHPLALALSDDDVIGMIGDWLHREPEARRLSFELVKSMLSTHLRAGHDVVLPYLIVHPDRAAAFEHIAQSAGATYFEFVLLVDKATATQRMLERGAWGEPGSPPVTAADKPIIEELYDNMHTALQERPHAVRITPVKGDIAGTYQQMMNSIAARP